MRIVFATPLAAMASTLVGRTIPIAAEFATAGHEVHVLVLGNKNTPNLPGVTFHAIGQEPFIRTQKGKQRLSGLSLLISMFISAWHTTWILKRLQPDNVIIVKTLPISVAGVWGWRLLGGRGRIVLDTDDFELAANHLSSIFERAVVHFTERRAIALADTIIAATPFLVDHVKQLAHLGQSVALIPTGLNPMGELHTNGPKNSLVYIGSVSITSGHRVDLLPDILAAVRQQYPDTTLTIAGDGDDVVFLKDLFAQRKLSEAVHWHGRFNAENIADLMTTETILLDPIDSSIAARAKSSYRVALATQLGLPVVSSNIGIRPELLPVALHDRFFAQPGDAHSYAAKIISLRQTPLIPSEQIYLRQHAEQFTWTKLAANYLATLSL